MFSTHQNADSVNPQNDRTPRAHDAGFRPAPSKKVLGFTFKVLKKLGRARLSELTTPHGTVPGPFFQFVATQAAIRGMVFSEDLEKLGVDIVLANTYHLHIHPGEDVVAEAGGLHGFMQWAHPITTDSGGYQVFSLSNHLKLDADGVNFHSPLDGASDRLTPESVMDIQAKLGADLVMPLDICTRFGAPHDEVATAVAQTTTWARRCWERHLELESSRRTPQALYGIVQGSTYPDLREQSASALLETDFFGFAIGGELRDATEHLVDEGVKMTIPLLPEGKPRYLMGSGAPEDVVRAVRVGVDQFDCVLPVRNARHGKIYRDLNIEELTLCLRDPERPVDPAAMYASHDLTKSSYRRDPAVFSPGNPAIALPYANAYVHHLLRHEGPSGYRLTVLHNIHFYVQLFAAMRDVISTHGQPAI